MSIDVDIFSGFISFLDGLSHDPVIYSIVFFIYAVAATIFLPIPVETGLFFSPETSIFVKGLILGTGKAVGSIIVFTLGDKVNNGLVSVMSRSRFTCKFMDLMQRFVARTRYYGLYAILSVPLMVDTVPLYLFSLFNQKGLMRLRYFVLTNFLAGITRATIVYLIFDSMGIKLI
jgi:hypothetical protein